MPEATITSKGQVTIPKSVRDELHLQPGDRVDFMVEADGRATMRPRKRSIRELAGSLRRRGRKPATLEEMQQAIEAGASPRR